MRRKSLLTFIFGLLMLAGIGISQAQTITLMEYTNQWRYLITNALPTGWSASNYPAANGWPMGMGVLAFPANEALPAGVPAPANTVLATNFGSSYVTSFYFRASITLTAAPNQLIINGSAVVDDGAVIYVNGREAQRIRMPAPPAAITPNTFASAGGEVAARIDTFTLASSNFVQGVNIIAVEVHQDGPVSSDVVFGLRLTAQLLTPIAITVQPQDQTAELGQTATFSVTATGSNPQYRWFSNNVAILPLSTATNSSYTTTPVTAAMNGRIYHVVVSNGVNSVRSSNAVLTVVADTTGPQLIQANPNSTNQFVIVFNEQVLRLTNDNIRFEHSISNLNNYSVHIFGTTNELQVTNVFYGLTQLRLTLNTNLDLNSSYVICVYNLQDVKTNTTLKDCIGFSFPITNSIFGFNSVWQYAGFVMDNRLAMTNWTEASFNDVADGWGPSLGVTFYDQDFTGGTAIPCTPLGDGVFIGFNTYYFRKKFSLASTFGSSVTAIIRHAIDDGAVFYINGREIGRFNMPGGPVDYFTPASGQVINFNCLTLNANFDGSILRVGNNNVLAVEVHQHPTVEGSGQDIAFDAALSFSYRLPPVIPTLSIARVANNLQFRWDSTNYFLESSMNLSGPWTRVTTNPNLTNFSTARPTIRTNRFYRLSNP